jgi:hypothetical protein
MDFRLLFLLISFCTSMGIAQTDVYGEISNNNRIKNTTHFTKLTHTFYHPTEWAQSYVGVAISGDSLTTEKEIYNDNFSAPLIGVRFKWEKSPVWLFSEYRHIAATKIHRAEPLSVHDLRLGFATGGTTDLKKFPNKISLFNEVYAEGVYSSRLESNIFAAAFDKLGFQKNWNSKWSTQVYTELYGRRDLKGHYYENLQELRLGVRQRFIPPPFSLTVSAHLAAGSFTDREYLDQNPYGKYYKDTVLLLVFGSQL